MGPKVSLLPNRGGTSAPFQQGWSLGFTPERVDDGPSPWGASPEAISPSKDSELLGDHVPGSH